MVDGLLAALGIALAYLLGSIPTAYVLTRVATGQDIRTRGTGNVGALNAYQQLGLAAGIVILLADVGKGVVAVFLPLWLGAPDWARFGSAFAVVAGHNWPVFLGFRGGKGAATVLGVGLALAPPLAGLALIPVVLGVATIRNVVVGVASGFILFNVLTIATGESWPLVGVCVALTFGVIGSYLSRTLRDMVQAARQRHWRAILYRE